MMHKLDKVTLFATAGSAAIPVVVGATLICVNRHQTGLALLIGGIVPFLSSVLLLLYDYWIKQKAVQGVLKVTLREKPVIFEAIKKDLKRAKFIQILGNILFTDLFKVDDFNNILEGKANEDFEIRICLYKPDNPFLRKRASDEILDYQIERKQKKGRDIDLQSKVNEVLGRMNADLGSTLDKIIILKKKLNKKLTVKYIDSTYILNSIIIVDDKMVVVDYLHQRGSGSPVFVLKGNPVCKAYQQEFERMWEQGREVDENDVR